jgi:hypothetical protein
MRELTNLALQDCDTAAGWRTRPTTRAYDVTPRMVLLFVTHRRATPRCPNQ